MVEKKILLGCSGGLFLQSAGGICEMALKYRCRSELLIGEDCYNLRSVLSVLSALSAQSNPAEGVTLRCDGTDEAQAAEALSCLLEKSAQAE